MASPATTSVAQTPRSDPPQDPAGPGCPAPNRFARAVSLVRKLIDYGMALASTLTQHTACLELVTMAFATDDIAQIIARIARALHIAAALEGHLVAKAALPEKPPAAARQSSICPPSAAYADAWANPAVASSCAPLAADAAQAAGQPAPPAAPGEDGAETRLARLPSAEELAEMFRHRPIGVVIGELCVELGITPGHELWREMFMVMLDHGGNPHRVYMTIMHRNDAYFPQLLAKHGMTMQTPLWPPMPEGWTPGAPAAGGTRPP